MIAPACEVEKIHLARDELLVSTFTRARAIIVTAAEVMSPARHAAPESGNNSATSPARITWVTTDRGWPVCQLTHAGVER